MRKRSIILTLVLAALLASALPALAAANTTAALDYLKTQQNADGGFGNGFSPDSTIASTADVVQAIVAAGGDLAAFDQNGKTPLTYLSANAPSAATAGDLAKLILAAIAAGENPRTFGGVDSVAKLESMIGGEGRIGGDKDTFVSHVLAVMALASAQQPIPAAAVNLIKDGQQENGGWAWDGSSATAADTNTTAFAVQALIAAGEPATSDIIANALAYYKNIQNEDGGWPYQSPSDYGTTTDANSTSVAIQAIIAAGQDPAGAEWGSAAGSTPVSALEGFQNVSGAFAWQLGTPDDNLLATVQALPALAGKAFPLATANVGAASAATASAAAASSAAPTTVPQTGGAVLNLALPLILSGLALAGGGYAMRRRK
jgi:squalene cyclase